MLKNKMLSIIKIAFEINSYYYRLKTARSRIQFSLYNNALIFTDLGDTKLVLYLFNIK